MFNDWVQIGNAKREDMCLSYLNINLSAPSWGFMGEDNEDITQYVVCCSDVSDDAVIVIESDGHQSLSKVP